MEDSKLHEETKKIAKALIEKDPALKDWVTEKFPELKESEDEKMIRIITKTLQDINNEASPMMGDTLLEDCIALLEKQGESKPIGKIQLSEELYEHIRNTCACIDDALSSETLADIKDYLSMAERSAQSAFDMIEKQGEQNPAWSEQHIADVFEKVGLARIVREQGNDQLTNAVQSAMIELSKQQKSWSEEDENAVKVIMNIIKKSEIDPDHAIIPAIHQRIKNFNVGDKVKIIIVKED